MVDGSPLKSIPIHGKFLQDKINEMPSLEKIYAPISVKFGSVKTTPYKRKDWLVEISYRENTTGFLLFNHEDDIAEKSMFRIPAEKRKPLLNLVAPKKIVISKKQQKKHDDILEAKCYIQRLEEDWNQQKMMLEKIDDDEKRKDITKKKLNEFFSPKVSERIKDYYNLIYGEEKDPVHCFLMNHLFFLMNNNIY